MVHALEIIHNLLDVDGFLLDIHPSPDPPPIEVRLGEQYVLAGWLKEVDDYVEYIRADQTIEEVVRRGLFTLEKRGTFTFNTYVGSIGELRTYLAENWQDAVVDEQVAGRAEDLMQSPEKDKEVVLRELVQISRLRPLGLGQGAKD
jgi:hypothetical protein